MQYKHLSYDERLAIAYYLSIGSSISEIARLVCRPYNTIKRELKRHRMMNGKYNPTKAQKSYRKRITSKKCASKYTEDMADKIACQLSKTFSPQQIEQYDKIVRKENMVSVSTIYRWIRKGRVTINGKIALSFLREKGKKRQKRQLKTKHFKNGKNISERAKKAGVRSEIGH